MAAVTEQDPREGLGEAIEEFVAWLEERGVKGTDAILVKVAKSAFTTRQSLYRWRNDTHECTNTLTAKAVREAMAEHRKKIEESLG